MKKSFLGSFIGICILLTLESLTRVIIALYMKENILMFSYSNYPGVFWPVLITIVAGFSSFFGAMFSLTYGRKKQIVTLLIFGLLLILLRYSQIHILYDTETIFYPVVAFILSLLALFIAWKVIRKPDSSSELYKDKDRDKDKYKGKDSSKESDFESMSGH